MILHKGGVILHKGWGDFTQGGVILHKGWGDFTQGVG